mmetsp:Transcript_70803/g.124955  ORF Transcript_70803/g.124955 Transcript_70803/m.124955 type:complete len:374 (-) Transcript_70803:312-1433(-)
MPALRAAIFLLQVLGRIHAARHINNEMSMTETTEPSGDSVSFEWGSPCTITPPQDGRSTKPTDTCRDLEWSIRLPWNKKKPRTYECRQTDSGRGLQCLYKSHFLPNFRACKEHSECRTGFCAEFEGLCLYKPNSLTWGSKCAPPALSVTGCPEPLDCRWPAGEHFFHCSQPRESIKTGEPCHTDDECQPVLCGQDIPGCTNDMYGSLYNGSCRPRGQAPGNRLPHSHGKSWKGRVCSFMLLRLPIASSLPYSGPWQPKKSDLVYMGPESAFKGLVGRLQAFDPQRATWTVSFSNGESVDALPTEFMTWAGSESEFYKFRLGQKVQLSGLVKTQSLNGRQGWLLSYNEETRFWKVQLEERAVLTRERNLLLLSD